LAAPILIGVAWRWFQSASDGSAERPFEANRQRTMTRAEALRVLGLREGASREAIRRAHRDLIKKVHPDHGGSDVLAQQVNEAKRVLE
jgi:DnaJ-class molecular chaperone